MNFIGIDGGGTKTIGIIVDETGKVIASHTVGGTNPNGVGMTQARTELTTLIEHLLAKVGLEHIAGCFAGMAGTSHPSRRIELEQCLRQLLPGVPVEADIDPVNALYSGSINGTGVVFISGTGSICMAINAHGERIRVGGWGYLIGDEGSGYDFGRRTLNAVMKGFDGRLQSSPTFTAKVLEYYGCECADELIPIIYDAGVENIKVSAVAPLLFEAYEEGDSSAVQIVHDVLDEMVLMIRTALNRLRLSEPREVQAQVVLVGSIFQHQKKLVATMKARLEEEGFVIQWTIPQIPPVAGAVAKAMMNHQGFIPSDFDKQFLSSF